MRRLKEVNLGSFNTHLGIALGGGLSVILAGVGLSKDLGWWLWPILIFGAIGTVAGLSGLALDAWRSLRPDINAPRTEEVSTDPQRALVMTFEEEHVNVFQHDAWILQVKVSVHNRDRIQHRLVGPWELTNVQGVGVIPGLLHEVDRIKHDRPLPSSVIEAGKTVEGWYVEKIAYTPVDGIPNYQLTVQAETGYDYGFRGIGSPKVPIAPNDRRLAPLEIRHRPEEPYAFARVPGRPPNVYSVGIYNPRGNPPITRVQMQVLGMNPVPNDHGNSPEFPAAVPRKTGGDPRSGVTLEPDTEELWEIANADPDGDGNFFVREIALPAWPLGRNQMWTLKRGDRWRLRFQISADGLPSRSFQVAMQVVGDAVQCQLEGVTP